MTIPSELRDRIGGPGLTPTWRLWSREYYAGAWVDVTDQLLTEGDSAITLTLDATTAPSRLLTITEPSRPGTAGYFEQLAAELLPDFASDLRNTQFMLEAGWIIDGNPHVQDMGRYWIEELTPGTGEHVATLASTETLLLRMHDVPSTLTGGLLHTIASEALTPPAGYTPAHHFARRVIEYAVAGDAWEHEVGFVASGDSWTPATVDDFPVQWGTQLWAALNEVGTLAGWSLAARDDGLIRARAITDPQTNVATLTDGPDGQITHHTRPWRPDTTIDRAGIINDATDPPTIGLSAGDAGMPFRTAIVESYSGNSETPNLTALAKANYRRHMLAARNLTLTADAMPWLRADDLVTITLAGIPETLNILTATFNIVAGEMNLNLRKAD